MRTFLYSFQVAIKNLWLEKWITLLTVLTITVGLLILGTFVFITINMDTTLKRWAKGFGIMVYLKEDLSPDEENLLGEYFRKDPEVIDIKYISKNDALKELRQILGTKTSILEGFEKSPLPSSFEIKLKRESLDIERIKQKAFQIKQLTGVEDVQYGEKWLSSLNALTRGMKIIAMIFGSLIFIAITFTTYSTIKILFYRRIDEIETLKLLGATRSFIRFPFLLEGFFIGIFGGTIGLAGLLVLYSLTTSQITEILPSMKGLMVFPRLKIYLPAIPAAGAVMSLIGSFFAIGKIRY